MRVQHRVWLVGSVLAVCAGLAACGSEAPSPRVGFRDYQPATLAEAVLVGNRTAVENFLALGVDPNEPEPDGTTPLMRAVHLQRPEIAELLIAASADVNKANFYGVTPLYIAARAGDPVATQLLLAAGANANTALAAGGETVLMIAAKAGSPDVVRALLTGGTNVSLLDLAEQRAQAQVFESAGYTVARNPTAATNYADVNARDRWYGRTALMIAASEGHVDVVQLLIEAGAAVDLLDEEGSSALMLARSYGHLDVAATLVAAGAG